MGPEQGGKKRCSREVRYSIRDGGLRSVYKAATHRKAEPNAVVLEVAVVDQQQRRLQPG